jgi:hypothetical protein
VGCTRFIEPLFGERCEISRVVLFGHPLIARWTSNPPEFGSAPASEAVRSAANCLRSAFLAKYRVAPTRTILLKFYQQLQRQRCIRVLAARMEVQYLVKSVRASHTKFFYRP